MNDLLKIFDFKAIFGLSSSGFIYMMDHTNVFVTLLIGGASLWYMIERAREVRERRKREQI